MEKHYILGNDLNHYCKQIDSNNLITMTYWVFSRNPNVISFLRDKKEKAKEYSLDKEQTSYDDLLDVLRHSLKGYNFK